MRNLLEGGLFLRAFENAKTLAYSVNYARLSYDGGWDSNGVRRSIPPFPRPTPTRPSHEDPVGSPALAVRALDGPRCRTAGHLLRQL
jgi:hypothetical protein